MFEQFERLIAALSKLPSLGRRSAERMAIRLLRDGRKTMLKTLIAELQQAEANLCACSECGAITSVDKDPCTYCTSPQREAHVLCVVEDAGDVMQMEKASAFRGRYHVLGGKLSPMRGEGLAQLRLEKMMERIEAGGFTEVILALNTDVESDATSHYISDQLSSKNVKVSRIATGIPVGSGLAYADPVTLARAISGRQDI